MNAKTFLTFIVLFSQYQLFLSDLELTILYIILQIQSLFVRVFFTEVSMITAELPIIYLSYRAKTDTQQQMKRHFFLEHIINFYFILVFYYYVGFWCNSLKPCKIQQMPSKYQIISFSICIIFWFCCLFLYYIFVIHPSM